MKIGKTPTVYNMVATPFRADGAIDEPALRALLRWMIEENVGVYMGSGGAGEGHALSLAELRQVYDIGVDECKGRIPVHANPPEPRTAAAMLEVARQAVAANVDVVQLYPLDAGHAMRPTLAEQAAYYDELLGAIDHPAALSVHVHAGYSAPVSLLAAICKRHPQVVAINVMGAQPGYMVELFDTLDPRIVVNVRLVDAIGSYALGARGFLAAEPNLAPRLSRSIVDAIVAQDLASAGARLAQLVRLATIVNRWAPSTARWVKMGMKVLDLPGGRGGLRKPYLMPPPADLNEMAAAFARLDLEEWHARRDILGWNWLHGDIGADAAASRG